MNLTEIGQVHNQFTEPVDLFKIRKCESKIIIHREFAQGLYGIENSEYLQILYGFHSSPEYPFTQKNDSGNIKGIFASVNPRPYSPLGMTTAKLISVKENIIIVTGLDTINTTPIYDIKPVVFDVNHNEDHTPAPDEKMKIQFPRETLYNYIKSGNLKACLLKAGEFHGNFCPHLTLGVMASVYGLQILNFHPQDDNESLYAISEINNCFIDGVQMISGCTTGNNTLLFRDLNKRAVTFITHEKKNVRIAISKKYRKLLISRFSEFPDICDQNIHNNIRDEYQRKKWNEQAREVSFFLITQPLESIFKSTDFIQE